MTKGENFGLQAGTGSKTGGDQSQKCDEKRVAHGQGYGLTNGRKLCVFRLDGVFGTDTVQKASEANGKLVESVDSTFQPKAKIEMEAENEGENLARSLPADMACNKSSGGFVPHFTPEKPAGESVIITG